MVTCHGWLIVSFVNLHFIKACFEYFGGLLALRPLIIAALFSGTLIFPFKAHYADFGINFDKALFIKTIFFSQKSVLFRLDARCNKNVLEFFHFSYLNSKVKFVVFSV